MPVHRDSQASPMPPHGMTTTALGVSSYRPQRTKYSPVSDSGADEHTATAMNSTKRPHTSALPVILSGNDALHSRSAQIRNASARANVDAACAYPLFVPPHAYETFISHEPPPTDSWITVETTPGEHRLLVRLPGFKRNGITLTRRKHRILHVVADLWCEPGEGGGHFERCISFGDDVHLAQVRAEFELGAGLLRIVIPRNVI